MYLLVQAYQHLWLVPFHEVYQQFTYVGHTIKPDTLSTLMLADIPLPHGFDQTFTGQVILFLSALYSG